MFSQIVSMLSTAVSNIASWFVVVLDSAGMSVYFLVAIFLLLLSKFLLRPLFGRAGSSDTVKRSRSED